MEEAIRTLTYRRAAWLDNPVHTLEDYVIQVHTQLSATRDRSFDYSGDKLIGMAWEQAEGVVLVHIAQYDPEASMSVIPNPSQKPSAEPTEVAPPTGNEFLRGDIFTLIKEDDILICPSGAREAVIPYFLERASERMGQRSFEARCKIKPVANLPKLRLLQDEGVRRIHLDSTLYAATYDLMIEQSSVRGKFLAVLAKAIKDHFSKDQSLREIGVRENIKIGLDLSFDGRRRGGEIGQRRLQELAENLIEQGEEGGFFIETREGKLVKAEELKVNRKAKLATFGNSIDREAAWRSLIEFYLDLKSQGALAS